MQYSYLISLALGSAGVLASGIAMAQVPPPKLAPQTPTAAAVAAYWTPERMASATVKDTKRSEPPNNVRQTAAPGATGAPGAVPGTLPTIRGVVDFMPPSQKDSRAPNAAPNAPAPSAEPPSQIVPADGSYPGPHATYEYYPKYRLYPTSTVGKLFFTEPAGNYVCTATVTYGGGARNMIWTAGHCVGPGGGASYYTNFYFCPSYDSSQGGPNPAVGCWSWAQAQQTGSWYYHGAYSGDYAWIKLQSSGSVINANVVDAVGGLGFAWNWARDQQWNHYGYPAQTPWTGGKLVATNTEHRYDDSADAYGPGTNAWGSGQTPGSSGSSLIRKFSYAGGGYINSNVSYYWTSPTNEYAIMLHGPYYDTNVCNFWKGGSGWTGTC
jgi:hypothetical protein